MPINIKFLCNQPQQYFSVCHLNFIVDSSANEWNNVIDLDYYTDTLAPRIREFAELVKQSPFHNIQTEVIVTLGICDNGFQLFTNYHRDYMRPGGHAARNRVKAYRSCWLQLVNKARKIADGFELPEGVVKERPRIKFHRI